MTPRQSHVLLALGCLIVGAWGMLVGAWLASNGNAGPTVTPDRGEIAAPTTSTTSRDYASDANARYPAATITTLPGDDRPAPDGGPGSQPASTFPRPVVAAATAPTTPAQSLLAPAAAQAPGQAQTPPQAPTTGRPATTNGPPEPGTTAPTQTAPPTTSPPPTEPPPTTQDTTPLPTDPPPTTEPPPATGTTIEVTVPTLPVTVLPLQLVAQLTSPGPRRP